MVTIKDIAKTVGVSASTVSRALSDSPLVKETTKRRIHRVARRFGYERNELARALVVGASHAVGLVIPDITNPFFSDIARGVGEIADRSGYGLLLSNTDGRTDRELSAIRLLRRKRVDGLLLCSTTVEAPYLEDIQRGRVPFILVSHLYTNPDLPYVITDDHAGARLAVEHLVDLGHQKIAFIGGPENVQASQDRLRTYLDVLAEHDLPSPPEWQLHAALTQAAGREAGQILLSLAHRPTAIFATNDVMALGVLEVAEGSGYRVPDDLSIIGYDNISYASLPRIQLTTIAQPAVEMGQIAATWLLSRIKSSDEPPLQRILSPRLVVRSTTAPELG